MKIPYVDPVTGFPVDVVSGGVSEPLQERSRRTLERLLAAAGELLEERTFHELTVQEVVRRAGSSVGSFYARFEDKEALLDYLDELYARQMIALVNELAEELEADPPDSLRATARAVFARLVPFHRTRRGLIRALVLRARERREVHFDDRTRRMNHELPRLLACLLRHRGEIAHPDPEQATGLGFALAFAGLRDRILFPESIRLPTETTDARLVEESAHLLTAYLTTPPENPS